MSKKPLKHRTRILIVDDHPTVRAGLMWRLSQEADLEVCDEAENMAQALRLIAEANPDVAVLNISLKSDSGLELNKRIKDHSDQVRMLVWSMHSEALYA